MAGLLAIYVWAAFWSTAVFGILWKVKMLRIDRETEFRGNDMVSKVRSLKVPRPQKCKRTQNWQ